MTQENIEQTKTQKGFQGHVERKRWLLVSNEFQVRKTSSKIESET